MLKKLFCLYFLMLFCFQASFAQTANQPWEYLIVSVSNSNDKKELSVPAKWMGIRQGNVGFIQQTLTQNEFDRLGILGWELVGVDDQIGETGTVSKNYIFKRIFSSEQSNYEKELQKMLLEKLSKSNTNEAEVVDLDKLERDNKQTQINNQVAGKLEQKLKSISKFKLFDIKSSASIFKDYKNVRAEITVDGTQSLLTESNKYRSSEVDSFIRQVAEEVYKTVGLQPTYANQPFFENDIYNPNGNETFIQIKVVVNVGGKYITLAQGKTRGFWDEVKNY